MVWKKGATGFPSLEHNSSIHCCAGCWLSLDEPSEGGGSGGGSGGSGGGERRVIGESR